MIAAVAHPELLLNDFADAPGGPDVAPKAIAFGSPGQQGRQLRQLFSAQTGPPSQRRAGLQCRFSPFSPAFHPLADRSFADPQSLCDLVLLPSLPLEVPGLFASFFSPIGFSWCSH